MKLGAGLALMNIWDKTDAAVYQSSLRLAQLVEPLGFDSLWTVEHHFTGHSPVPNAIQLLTYMAGRTSRIQLGTAVITLPWHHPIRVAEEICVLDILSQGRTIFGFGRGVGAVEYEGFGIPMEEARARFVEAVEIIIAGLTQERFSYRGKFFDIPEISIRPRAISNPEQRFYGAAVSPESAEIMAELNLGLLISPQRELDSAIQTVQRYNAAIHAAGHVPKSPVTHTYVSIDDDREVAWERARRYMRPMFAALNRHYKFSVGQLDGVKGYEHYTGMKPYDLSNDMQYQEEAIEAFIQKQMVGTPVECLDRISDLSKELGVEHFVGEFSYGGMPFEECAHNLQVFANKVGPVVHDPASFLPAG